ncbi:MAG TPA: LPXTG cell wall anchor domain-containing protein [Candidatus Limosilactobacillus merdigallinarum]|uniref:LPXTG cell wall anchor domain-containing protein n=1 Tax=Candidatus Limosilactobacillus merdigallinarum TaxID=2838652 RepID=A0A9D1VGK9_9LACO|nr:LPXTG cell wall anchor domain-containing protein [Candidatus Limosilactobacillus merdigallinarum]
MNNYYAYLEAQNAYVAAVKTWAHHKNHDNAVAVVTAKNARDAAQSKVQSALNARDNFNKLTQAFTTATENYNNAKVNYLSSLGQYNSDSQLLDHFNKTSEAFTTAAINYDNAKEAFLVAQGNLTNANKTLEQFTQTDADKYGDLLKGGTITITAGEVPAVPSIDDVAGALKAAKVNFATVETLDNGGSQAPSKDQITDNKDAQNAIASVAWADPAQVAKDSKTAGTYTEKLLVTFKDGSTKTIDYKLVVKPSSKTDDNNQNSVVSKVEWADPAQVAKDSKTPGTYTEKLLVTFKDGSTKTIDWTLVVKPNESKNDQQNDNKGTQTPSTSDVQAAIKSGKTGSSVVVKAAAKKSVAKKAAAKKLPQTGNNSAVVALGALTGMLGLGLAAKKREF